MDDLSTRYQSLRSTLETNGFIDLPPHLLWRLTVLVAGNPVRFAEVHSAAASPRSSSGTALLFTDKRVIRAAWGDSSTEPNPAQAATFTVEMTTWPRSLLQEVQLLPDAEDWRNSDGGWSHVNLKEDLPEDLSVTLHYKGREPLTLPMHSPRTSAFIRGEVLDFLPSLIADLST